MTIRALGLASATTSLQDHRLALGMGLGPGASVLERRAGLYYYPGSADLVGVSALQASVAPLVAVVDGTSNALQGQVVVVVDAAETLTFSAGEAGVARTDRVVLQVRDNAFDASGATDARLVIVKGNTGTGAANPVPASSILLWEVVVPIGASSITFASARVDKRQWTATPLRVPVNSSTERNALPAIPGLEVTRLDTGDVEQYWSGAWRITSGGAQPSVRISKAAVSVAASTWLTISFTTEAWDTAGIWNAGQPTRITVPAGSGGVWAFGGALRWTSLPSANIALRAAVSQWYDAVTSDVVLDPEMFVNGATLGAYTQSFSGVSQMLPGEWLTLDVAHSYASAVNVIADFWAYRISG